MHLSSRVLVLLFPTQVTPGALRRSLCHTKLLSRPAVSSTFRFPGLHWVQIRIDSFVRLPQPTSDWISDLVSDEQQQQDRPLPGLLMKQISLFLPYITAVLI